MKILIRLVIGLALLHPDLLWAQQPYSIRIDKSTGLPSNSVYNLLQDARGYIWIAHNEGLSRYDGFEFKTYESALQTSKAGSALKEDRFGRIWYQNFDGYTYYVEHDSLKMLNHSKPIGYFPMGITDEHIFLMNNKGLDVFDLKTLRYLKSIDINHQDLSYSLSDKYHFYIMTDSLLYKIDGLLNAAAIQVPKELISSEKHLYYLNNQLIIIQKYNHEKKVYTIKDEAIVELFPLKDISFIQGAYYADSSYWFLTPKGAYQYNKSSNQEYFSDKNISFILKDQESNYWFSTVDEGIILVPNIQNIIRDLNGQIPNKISLAGNNYLIGTKRGQIIEISKDLKQTKHLFTDAQEEGIHYLYFDSTTKNYFYVSKGFGVIPKGDFTKALKQELALKDFCKIDDQYYAFAATGPSGLFKSPSASPNKTSDWDKTFKEKNLNNLNYSTLLSQSRGKSVAYSPSEKSIYIASNLGLFKCGLQGTEEIKSDGESLFFSKLSIWNNTVYGLSTKGDLYAIDNNGVKNINARYNLPDGDITQIKQFENWLFLFRSNSLDVLDLSSSEATIINIGIDINAQEINDLLLDNDQLILLTDQGIIRLNFSVNNRSKVARSFYINSFKVNNQQEDYHQFQTFSYDNNNIEINFSLLQFGSSKHAKVYYQINQDEWKQASSETRTLDFPALAPGKYQFRFKIDETIITEASVKFTIASPFWLTWWFLILCIVFVFAIAYIYYKWQTGILIKQNQLLRDKISLEQSLSKSMLTSIKSQMNPHFFYNALNTIQSYIFTNDKRNASNYLAKFSKLTRMILEMSEKETIYLHEEVMALNLYLELEKMRFNNDFEYSIKVEDSVDTDMVKIPSMIIQPYVENAVKHGLLHKRDEKKLDIVFRKTGHILTTIVDDNGIGRKRSEELNKIKSDKCQSFSSQANEKRLEILNRGKSTTLGIQIIDKQNESGLPIGTRVELTIPIS